MDPRTRDIGRRPLHLKAPPPRLFWVTDDGVVARTEFVRCAAAVLGASAGRCALQLRAHGLDGRSFKRLAARLRELADATGNQLWVNDRIDVALVVRADGVQLGVRSPAPPTVRELVGFECAIGYSAHSVAEAESAVEGGADVVVLGSVYPTVSHADRSPLGLEPVRAAGGRGKGRPIVALGGITAQKVGELLRAGAWGVAIKSGVWDAPDPGTAAREYLAALDRASSGLDATADGV